jgi:hypothetical protein
MDYIKRCAFVRAVKREAARWGYRGDVLTEPDRIPLVGTVQQQHHLATIYHDVEPRPRTENEREFVKRLCRAVVLTEQPDSCAKFAQEITSRQPQRARAW